MTALTVLMLTTSSGDRGKDCDISISMQSRCKKSPYFRSWRFSSMTLTLVTQCLDGSRREGCHSQVLGAAGQHYMDSLVQDCCISSALAMEIVQWQMGAAGCHWQVLGAAGQHHMGGLVHDCCISIALAMEILQSCTKLMIWLAF